MKVISTHSSVNSMESPVSRSVRWTGDAKRQRNLSDGNGKNRKKRYATRDQPTWNNCKLPRPTVISGTYWRDILTSEGSDFGTKNTFIECDQVTSSRRSTTPKSSRLLSARSSFSKVTNSWSISSTDSRESSCRRK